MNASYMTRRQHGQRASNAFVTVLLILVWHAVQAQVSIRVHDGESNRIAPDVVLVIGLRCRSSALEQVVQQLHHILERVCPAAQHSMSVHMPRNVLALAGMPSTLGVAQHSIIISQVPQHRH